MGSRRPLPYLFGEAIGLPLQRIVDRIDMQPRLNSFCRSLFWQMDRHVREESPASFDGRQQRSISLKPNSMRHAERHAYTPVRQRSSIA